MRRYLFLVICFLFLTPSVFAANGVSCENDYAGICVNSTYPCDIPTIYSSDCPAGTKCVPETANCILPTPVPRVIPQCPGSPSFCGSAPIECTDDGLIVNNAYVCSGGGYCCTPEGTSPIDPFSGGNYYSGGSGITSSTDPRKEGFDPLKYPCDATADPEFHPLRPYPGSPCDPLELENPNDPDPRKYQEPVVVSCGTSFNVNGSVGFPKLTTAQVTGLPPFPTNVITAPTGTLYRCGSDGQSICGIETQDFDIEIDLTQARLPVIGNTQDAISDATKVNSYLSWYLNGSVQHSDQTDLINNTPITGRATDDFACIGKSLAKYMNTIVDGVASKNLSHIKTLSPAFNIESAPTFKPYWDAMAAAGAKFSQLDGIAGNAYNVGGHLATYYVSAFLSAVSTTKPFFLTETGMIERVRDGVSLPTALTHLTQTISAINSNSQIQAALLFDSFATNPDPEFSYNFMTDDQIRQVCGGTTCTGGKIGINSAAFYSQSESFYEHAKNLGMGYTLEIASTDLNAVMSGINAAHARDLTPILRIGVNFTGQGFEDPKDLVNFLAQINSKIDDDPNKIVYVIAGPNEPNAEKWASSDCTDQTGIDRLINYSGPLKKLLARDSQLDIKKGINFGTFISNPQTNAGLNALHRYLINPPTERLDPYVIPWAQLLKNVPFSSLEDIGGEVILSLIPNQQPGSGEDTSFGKSLPEDNYVIDETQENTGKAITLKISAGSDSRIYIPHLKSINFLADLLASLVRPKSSTSVSANDTDKSRGIVKDHLGLYPNYTPNNNPKVQIDREYPTKPLVVTKNTQLIPLSPAPPPPFTDFSNWYSQSFAKPQDQRCAIEITKLTQDNPGDYIYGKKIKAKLVYSQVYQYAAEEVIPSSECPDPMVGDNGQRNQCYRSEQDKGVYSSGCCATSCEWRDGNNQCYYSSSQTGEEFCSSLNQGGTYCKNFGDTSLPTTGRAALFIKTPYLHKIYDTLVSGTQSVFRRFLYQKPPDYTPLYDFIAGEVREDGSRDLTQARPVSSQISIKSQKSSTGSTRLSSGDPTAGDTTDPRLYFPVLGSLADYFLGGPTLEQKNLQRMLRPYGLASNKPTTTDPNALACTIPLVSCDPVNWDNNLFNAYYSAYNSDDNDSWTMVKEPWAQRDIDNSGICPQFLATLWLEESGGSAIGAYDLGCIYFIDGTRAMGSDEKGGPSHFPRYSAFQQHYEPILLNQIACVKSYVNAIGDDFRTFMCQYSGEQDTDPSVPYRQCTTFTNNPNFPINICKIGTSLSSDITMNNVGLNGLGIFTGGGSEALEYVTRVNPKVVLILDNFGFANSVPASAITVGRSYSFNFSSNPATPDISPLNSLMTSNPQIDVWQAYTEILYHKGESDSGYQWQTTHDLAVIDAGVTHNKDVCIGNFKEGMPTDLSDHNLKNYITAIMKKVAENPSITVYLCVHEHEDATSNSGNWKFGTRYNGRFVKLLNLGLKLPVLVTVAGYDSEAGPDVGSGDGWQGTIEPDVYRQMLLDYQSAALSAGAKGVAVFQVGLPGTDWNSFNIFPLLSAP